MVHIFAQEHVCHQAGSRLALGYHRRWQRRDAYTGLATPTSQLGSNDLMANDPGRNILVALALLTTDLTLLLAAVRTNLFLRLNPFSNCLQRFDRWLTARTRLGLVFLGGHQNLLGRGRFGRSGK